MPNCGGVNFQIWSLFTPNQLKLQVCLILKAFNKRANLLKEDVLNRTVILPQGYLQTNFNDFFFQLRLWTTFIKVRKKYFYSEILLSSVRRFFFWSLGQMTSISSREYWYCRKHWQLPMVFFLRLIQFHFMCHFQTVSTLVCHHNNKALTFTLFSAKLVWRWVSRNWLMAFALFATFIIISAVSFLHWNGKLHWIFSGDNLIWSNEEKRYLSQILIPIDALIRWQLRTLC